MNTKVKISKEDYNKIFAEVTYKAHQRMIEGYVKYGDTLPEGFDFIKEAEEEVADAINYLVMGLIKMKEVRTMLEE